MNTLNPLEEYAKNITSQFGEDGILAEIFRRIGSGSKTCVEFGAWDGKHLSNSWKLWHEEGWQAVLIEGDIERCAELKASLSGKELVQVVQAFVQPEGPSSLDSILTKAGLPMGFDLLSVDVDGDEFHIWAGLKRHEARVVIVEFNPTIPPEIDLVQIQGAYFGASASSLVALAHRKGYKLAACTQTNCIFVRDRDFDAVGFAEPSLTQIFPRIHLTHVVNSYDGKTFITQNPIFSPKLPEYSASLLQELFLKERISTGIIPPGPVPSTKHLLPVLMFSTPQRAHPAPLVHRVARRIVAFTTRIVGLNCLRDLRKQRRERSQRIREWQQNGCPFPPPHEIKQEVLKKYAKAAKIRILVETGTYMGDMVEAMRHHFARIYSIELCPDFYSNAVERFSDQPHISILQGDSAEVLSRVLSDLQKPAIFWLDGHYSEGNTAKGNVDTPIIAELEQILTHSVKGHVILIDDARCFDGVNDYPTMEALRTHVLKYRPDANITAKDDIIRIVFGR